jgi:ADP-ribose pyrophosphatase
MITLKNRKKEILTIVEFGEKQLSSELIYDGRVVKLFKDTVRLVNGNESVREIVRHPGAVAVVPITEDGEIVLVRQFRYPFGEVLTEIPAGKLDPGEEPEAAALRELSEETGAEAESLEYLGAFYSSVAIFDEVIHLYLARGLKFQKQHLDEDEFLDVIKMPFEKAVELVNSDKIRDGKTQTAILKTALRLK